MPAPVERRRIFRRHLLRPVVAGDARQIQREDAALADFAGDHHFAAGLPGEAEHLRQAEPGALADLLGGEERFEDASELLAGNADAGVLDRHRDVTIGFLPSACLRDCGPVPGNSAALRTVMVSLPWPSMASRALTAMLIIAVSN